MASRPSDVPNGRPEPGQILLVIRGYLCFFPCDHIIVASLETGSESSGCFTLLIATRRVALNGSVRMLVLRKFN